MMTTIHELNIANW